MLIGAIMYAKNLEKLVAFYSKIGFIEHIPTKAYVVLTQGVSELTIIQSPDVIANEIVMKDPPDVRTMTAVKLVFEVDSIETLAGIINQSAGRIDRGRARWKFGDYFVQDAVDPEGNIFQLRERATKTL